MVNVTLSVPTELKSKMDKLNEVNWSAVARNAFDEKIKDIEFIKRFKSKSTMSEEDALSLGKELNSKISQRRS
ncbi:MAG: hypothetical protein ACLFUO_04210 [Candidatus Woesearchaeota archaeon]